MKKPKTKSENKRKIINAELAIIIPLAVYTKRIQFTNKKTSYLCVT